MVKHRKRITTDKMKEYNITYQDVADWFGYSSAHSFNGSTAKKDMVYGITQVIKQVESTLKKE